MTDKLSTQEFDPLPQNQSVASEQQKQIPNADVFGNSDNLDISDLGVREAFTTTLTELFQNKPLERRVAELEAKVDKLQKLLDEVTRVQRQFWAGQPPRPLPVFGEPIPRPLFGGSSGGGGFGGFDTPDIVRQPSIPSRPLFGIPERPASPFPDIFGGAVQCFGQAKKSDQ